MKSAHTKAMVFHCMYYMYGANRFVSSFVSNVFVKNCKQLCLNQKIKMEGRCRDADPKVQVSCHLFRIGTATSFNYHQISSNTHLISSSGAAAARVLCMHSFTRDIA